MIVPGQDMQINMTETCTTLYLREWPLQGWNICIQITMSRYYFKKSI